jgi:hypothetical protein
VRPLRTPGAIVMDRMAQLFFYKTDAAQKKLRCAGCGGYYKYVYDKGHVLECTSCGNRVACNIFNKPALLDTFWFSLIVGAAGLVAFSFGFPRISVLVSFFVGFLFAIGGFLVASIMIRGIFNRVYLSGSEMGISKLIYLDKNPIKFCFYAAGLIFLSAICLLPGIFILLVFFCTAGSQ